MSTAVMAGLVSVGLGAVRPGRVRQADRGSAGAVSHGEARQVKAWLVRLGKAGPVLAGWVASSHGVGWQARFGGASLHLARPGLAGAA